MPTWAGEGVTGTHEGSPGRCGDQSCCWGGSRRGWGLEGRNSTNGPRQWARDFLRINISHGKGLACSLGNFLQQSVWTVAAVAEGLGAPEAVTAQNHSWIWGQWRQPSFQRQGRERGPETPEGQG